MTAIDLAGAKPASPVTPVVHYVKGDVVEGTDIEFRQQSGMVFATPKLDLDSLVWPSHELPPAYNTPIKEIVDFLVALGARLASDPDGYMSQALENMAKTCTLERRIVDNCYRDVPKMFNAKEIELALQLELGGPDVLDGWREIIRPDGRIARIRACPPRLIHIMAGNAPGVAAGTVLQASLTKGVHLLKMPSNDLFTAPAILRTMAALDPKHPLVRSFSAVYWRGGDTSIEGQLCRPQYFDKLVAWGGESAIRSVKQYAGPGFELVTFDPKTSISFLGKECLSSEQSIEESAELAAIDSTPFNQGACTSSRFQFIEGSIQDIDHYCAALQRNLEKERHTTSAISWRVQPDMREEIDVLRGMEPEIKVWGRYEGKGIVIRSDHPVDFYPDGKIVNVVPVESLQDAIRYVTVATQTVGIHPPSRKEELRDVLAASGAQRVVSLGRAMGRGMALPHDGFWALNRYMRWITDED